MLKLSGMILALGLVLGACGGDKATCKKIMKKALACETEGQKGPGADLAAAMGDTIIDQACSEDEAASKVAKASSCLDESDCAKFDACLEKAAPDGVSGHAGP
jgi:hypothetical protein